MPMKPFRVTREYFLPDQELKKLLNLGQNEVILEVKRSEGTFRGKSVGKDQAMNLFGCIVVVLDTGEGVNGAR